MGGERHAPAVLPPKKGPGLHCAESWVGPRVGLDGCGHLALTYCYYTDYRNRTRHRKGKVRGKVHPCTGTEALYRPYGP